MATTLNEKELKRVAHKEAKGRRTGGHESAQAMMFTGEAGTIGDESRHEARQLKMKSKREASRQGATQTLLPGEKLQKEYFHAADVAEQKHRDALLYGANDEPSGGPGQPRQLIEQSEGEHARKRQQGLNKRMTEYQSLEKHAEKLSRRAEKTGAGAGANFSSSDWSGHSSHPQAQRHALMGHDSAPYLSFVHEPKLGLKAQPGDSYIANYQQESLPAGGAGKKIRGSR